MVSTSVLLTVSAVNVGYVVAEGEAISLLQMSSNKVVHEHNRSGTPYPDSTWPTGYKLPTTGEGHLDAGKVFKDNTQFVTCDKGWTPGSCYASKLNGRGSDLKWLPRGISASECIEVAKKECSGDFIAVNFETGLGECWCVPECTHNDYFSFTDYGQGAAPSVTCMLGDKLPYADVPKKNWDLFDVVDKKAKVYPNALQGNCDKNQWVLGTSVAKDGSFQGYVELGRQNGGEEPVFTKTATECIAMAAADPRCGDETAINWHFAAESKMAFDNVGSEPKGPLGNGSPLGGQCFCTGPQGPPTFTRKNWVHILSCMTAGPVLDDEAEPGPKPDKATCKACRERVKAARTAKKASRTEIKRLRELLKAEKAKLKTQKGILAEERATFKSCRR